MLVDAVPLGTLDNGRMIQIKSGGETKLVAIEPLNAASHISKNLVSDYFDTTITIGDIEFVLPAGIPTREPLSGSRLSGERIESRFGQEVFDNCTVLVDYISETISFDSIYMSETEIDNWLAESGSSGKRVNNTLRQRGDRRYVSTSAKLGDDQTEIMPLLLLNAYQLSRPGTSLIEPFSSEGQSSEGGRFGQLSFGTTTQPFVVASARKNGEISGDNVFCLRSLGPRRIAWNPTLGRLTYLQPSLKESVEAFLRSSVLQLPVLISGQRIRIGQFPALDDRRTKIENSEVLKIGEYPVSDILKAMSQSEDAVGKILIALSKQKAEGKLTVTITKDGKEQILQVTKTIF